MLIAKSREAAEGSLYEFVKQGWHVVEPGETLIEGRHIRLICQKLEQVSRGEIKDLLINIPPGHMKSLLVNVFWPAWEWTWNPYRRFMFASYADALSERDSVKCRRLIESDWYVERWGHVWALAADQNAKRKFENDKTGSRFITSVGHGTGEGANHLALDDPHNAMEIHSDTVRGGVLEWWQQVWASRMRPPGSGGRVVIMQRLHVDDLAGYLLKEGGWHHLCLPFEYDPEHPNLCADDWRTEPGEVLWPEMFTPEKAAKLKKDLKTDFAREGQLQQRPVPKGGGILKVQWWRIWPDREPPRTDFRLLSIDTAYTEREQNDSSAATLWGRFRDPETRQPHAIMMFAWCDRLEHPELVQKLHDLITRFKPTQIIIENKANGISVMQELRRRVRARPIIAFDPKDYGDKVARAFACQGIFTQGRDPKTGIYSPGVVWTLDRGWAGDVIEDCGNFPAITMKDRVDTVTQALIYLRAHGYIMPTDEVDYRYLHKMRPKPKPKPLYAVD